MKQFIVYLNTGVVTVITAESFSPVVAESVDGEVKDHLVFTKGENEQVARFARAGVCGWAIMQEGAKIPTTKPSGAMEH